MNRDEYLQLVGLIKANYEKPGAWDEPENYSMFAGFDADPVFDAYVQLRESGKYDDFPPKPPGVARLTRELLRHAALPVPDEADEEESVAPVTWEEGRASIGYDGMTVWEAAEQRHRELFEKFEPECHCPPGAHVACHSKECDIHTLIV